MIGRARSEAFASLEQYGRAITGLLAIIAISLVILAVRR